MSDEMVFNCPKCGSRNLTYTAKVTSCRACGWTDEKLVAKLKRKLRRKRVSRTKGGIGTVSLEK